MKRKLHIEIASMIILSLVLISTNINLNYSETATSKIAIVIDGKEVDFTNDAPFVDANNRTQVPFKIALEAFGAKVSWDDATKTAIATKDGIKIEVPIGKSYIYRNGVQIQNDTVAMVKEGRTYLPINSVFTALGGKVVWNQSIRAVEVTSQGNDTNLVIETSTTQLAVNGKIISTSTSKVGKEYLIPLKTLQTNLPEDVLNTFNQTSLNATNSIQKNGVTYIYSSKVSTLFKSTSAVMNLVEKKLILNVSSINYSFDFFTSTANPNAKYTELLKSDKSKFTKTKLEQLAKEIEPSKEVTELRNKANPRRDGLIKVEGQFMDMYYPNTAEGKREAEVLAPYIDLVYMYFYSMFDMQVHAEVHLIDPADIKEFEEGNIRRTEGVTFVYIEDENKIETNLINEFVHEVFHNFHEKSLQETTGMNDIEGITNEGIARMIASPFIEITLEGEYPNYDRSQLAAFDNKMLHMNSRITSNNFNPTFDIILKNYTSSNGWVPPVINDQKEQIEKVALHNFWSYIYLYYGETKFTQFLRECEDTDSQETFKSVYGKEMRTIYNEMLNYKK